MASAEPVSWWNSYRCPRARSTFSSASVSLPTAATVASSTPSGRMCSGSGRSSLSRVVLMVRLYPLCAHHLRPGDPGSRRVAGVNDRLVWIDCEMTGLDTEADALIEVAALVTD